MVIVPLDFKTQLKTFQGMTYLTIWTDDSELMKGHLKIEFINKE